MVNVSPRDAEAFAEWRSRRDGVVYRLPTEEEWEYAARSGGQYKHYPWGDNWEDNKAVIKSAETKPVGSVPDGANRWGVVDLIGNVWEWTASDFQPYPGFSIDPYREYSQPWFGTHKVLRGGCWATSSLLIRNTLRNCYTPDRRGVWVGFCTCAR